jgi:hypothetical protein
MTPPRQREVSVGTFALALTALSLALVAYFGA